MKKTLLAALVGATLISGCSNMSTEEQRMLSGTTGGAAAGAAIGAIAGNAALGAGIGAAVGLAGGYVYDQYKKSEQANYNRGYEAGQKSQ